MFNETVWKLLTSNPAILQMTPTWVHPFFSMSFAEIERLPRTLEEIDVVKEPHLSKPRVDLTAITPSYLDFLRREIRVRGSESKRAVDIYEGRLNALSKYEGKPVYQMAVFGNIDPGHIRSCIVFFLPESCKIVWVE
jgi:hypothetical protein